MFRRLLLFFARCNLFVKWQRGLRLLNTLVCHIRRYLGLVILVLGRAAVVVPGGAVPPL